MMPRSGLLRGSPTQGRSRTVAQRRRKPRVGVRAFLSAPWRPGVPLPVYSIGGRLHVQALPPHGPVWSQHHVGEDRILAHGGQSIGVRSVARARSHAEHSSLGVHRPEPAVPPNPHPGDVVANHPHSVALEGGRRDHHRQVRLATGARKAPATYVTRPDGSSIPTISMCSAIQPSR